MIFTKENIELIRQGKKTETRRIWKKPHVKVGNTYKCMESRFRKNEGPDVFITIDEIRKEPLGAITEEAALREGVASVSEFRNEWIELYGVWHEDQEVYVVNFHLVKLEENHDGNVPDLWKKWVSGGVHNA